MIQLMAASRKLLNKKTLLSSAKYSEHWASGEGVSVAKIPYKPNKLSSAYGSALGLFNQPIC